MLRVREVVEELRVFERNKVPFEVKIPGIVTCIQTSSLGRTARILSGFIQSLKPLFGTGKFEERLPACIREEEKILDSIGRNSC